MQTINPRGHRGFNYGWVVVGSFTMIFGTAYGTSNTFGVFFKPVSAELELSRTVASVAPALSQVLMNASALFWGLWADRWGARVTIGGAGILIGLGWLLSSTVHSAWQLYLFYGVILGIGIGGIAPPLVATTSRWFDQRRGLALGIGFAGLGAGVFLFSPLARWLIDAVGWRDALRTFAFIAWGVIVASAVLLRQPPRRTTPAPEQAPGLSRLADPGHEANGPVPSGAPQGEAPPESHLTVWQAMRGYPFLILSLMFFVATLVLFLVMVHLVPRATDAGVAPGTAVFTLSLVGLGSIVGKLGGGPWGDRVGPHRAFLITMLVQAAALFWLLAASSAWMFFLFALVFGISYGVWVPQVPSMMAQIFGLRRMASLYGALFLGGGMGGAVGPILAGWIFDLTESYFAAFALAGVLALGAALLPILLRRPHYRLALHSR